MPRRLPDRIRISAPVTPFSAKGDFMADAYAEIIRWHLEHGTRGFLIAADNGEHWALSLKEIGEITKICMRESKGKLPVYVGAWAITEKEAIERASAAADAGAYGLCVKPQHYVHAWAPATRADIVGRFEAIAKAVDLPMMIYNSPNRTAVNISNDDLEAITGVCNAECLKDTSHDSNLLQSRILRFHDKMSVLLGGGGNFYQAMMTGAGGIIGTVLDLFGHDADRIFEFEKMTNDERRMHVVRSQEVGHVINYLGTIPTAYKATWNMMGLPAGHLRDPLRPLSPEQENELRACLTKWGVLKGTEKRRAAKAAE